VQLIIGGADDTTMDLPDLDELLDRARSGDESAFSGLYRELQPKVLRYLQVQAADQAEDVAADTWLDVARAVGGFTGDFAAFRSWVFAIARNRLVDAVRRASRRPLHLVDSVVDLEAMVTRAGTVAPEAGARAEAYEATQRAIAAVRTLPPDQADVVMLRVVVGLDVDEVAALVGKPAGSVRVLAHRGLRRLARTLSAGAGAADDSAADEATAAPSGGHPGVGA
jgi:RNA polymerase sigma-70 factor, ECF subfamily